jgi:uncharacterized membrane protein
VEPVLTEWLSLLLRWLHVVAGIGWIGSSFYFIHLDLSLKPRGELPAGVKGDAWQVHGGGFYHMIKYVVAPGSLPEELTWFKWEAYTTWLSGFALLILVYYGSAELFLIDSSVLKLGARDAVLISLGTLVVAWAAYELACRSPLGRHPIVLSLIGYVFLVAVTIGFTHIFSGRGSTDFVGQIADVIFKVHDAGRAAFPQRRANAAGPSRGEAATA